jgi:uncharacterized protein
MASGDELIRMEVKGLMMDPSSNVPIVILRDDENSRFLPIWIGIFEANAIALQLEGIAPPRPMTHDLMIGLLNHLETEIVKVVISALENNTFFARITVKLAGRESSVDSRPSDAIALALRAAAPIYVAAEVLSKAAADNQTGQPGDEEKLKKWLEEIDPDDLGKYTM